MKGPSAVARSAPRRGPNTRHAIGAHRTTGVVVCAQRDERSRGCRGLAAVRTPAGHHTRRIQRARVVCANMYCAVVKLEWGGICIGIFVEVGIRLGIRLGIRIFVGVCLIIGIGFETRLLHRVGVQATAKISAVNKNEG